MSNISVSPTDSMDEERLQFSVIEQPEAMAGLREEWQLLLQQSSANPLFCSWELADIFWRHYADDSCAMRLVCVREGGQLLAIFPFYIRRRRILRVVPVRTLLWLGSGGDTSPDYLGAIVHTRAGQHFDNWLAEALALLRNEFDVAELRDMQRAPDIDELRQDARVPLLHSRLSRREIIVAELVADWDDYLARLSSNRRQQIRRARRKVFEQEGILLDRLSSVDQLDHWFDQLVRLHHKRWQQKGEGEHAFRTDAYNRFHREFMAAMLDGNALRLWGLKKNDQLIAMLYCLSDGNETYYFQGGFDTDYDELKPGMVLMSCAMEQAIREGCCRFDMMKGDYDFKRSLAKDSAFTWDLQMIRPTPAGLFYQLRFIALPALKRVLKK